MGLESNSRQLSTKNNAQKVLAVEQSKIQVNDQMSSFIFLEKCSLSWSIQSHAANGIQPAKSYLKRIQLGARQDLNTLQQVTVNPIRWGPNTPPREVVAGEQCTYKDQAKISSFIFLEKCCRGSGARARGTVFCTSKDQAKISSFIFQKNAAWEVVAGVGGGGGGGAGGAHLLPHPGHDRPLHRGPATGTSIQNEQTLKGTLARDLPQLFSNPYGHLIYSIC